MNNAYDADATIVDVKITDETVEVRDNGTGMDRAGLEQYFNIGSPFKLEASRSPVHHRDRIGQFGIGKFATLSACKRFEVTTRRGCRSDCVRQAGLGGPRRHLESADGGLAPRGP